MPFDPDRWTSISVGDAAVYLFPQGPDWFVPNPAGQAAIERAAAGCAGSVDDALFLMVAHDVAPRAMSPKVKGFVQAQNWYQNFSSITME